MQKKKLLTGDEFTCDNLPECWQYPLKSGKFKIIDLQEMNGETLYRLRTDNGHFYNLIDLSGVQTLQKEKGVWVLARYLEKVEKKSNLIESIEKNQNEIFKDFENGDNKKMAKYKINDKVTKVNLEMFNPLFKKKVELNGGKMPPLKIIGIRSSDDGNYTDYIVSLSKEDGGHPQPYVNNQYGYILREEWLEEVESEENEKTIKEKIDKKISMKESIVMKENTVINGDSEMVVSEGLDLNQERKRIRKFKAIMKPAVKAVKDLLFLLIRKIAQMLGESKKMAGHWIGMLKEKMKQYKEHTEKAIQWFIGWLATKLHVVKDLPIIRNFPALVEVLENPEIQRFGVQGMADAEGDALGDIGVKAMEFVQTNLFGFGSGIFQKVMDAVNSGDTEALMRFASDTLAEEHRKLDEKDAEAEKEAHAEMETAKLAVAPKTATV